MMIGIDGNEANVDNRVGVSVYTLELLKNFSTTKREDVHFTVFLRDEPKDCMPKENSHFTYSVVQGKFLWSQIFLPLHLLFRNDIDVFFAPAHYSPRFMRQPLIVTIHDLSYKYFPHDFLKKDLYKLEHWSKYSIMRANKIISVSKTTKKDILQNYEVIESQIEVIYNGFTRHKSPKDSASRIKDQYSLEKGKYLLHVGTIQPRKNILTLIQAFEKFHKSHTDFKLVLEGKKGWLYDTIFEKVKSLQLESSVIFTGYVSDEMESCLYTHAFCLVLPSLYEGFGLPILEAMDHGCPVIASHAASLPEIGGEACLYFDPNDSDDILEKLEKLMMDQNLYSTLTKKGKKRIQDFSWKKCAEETLSVLINYDKLENTS